MPDPDMGHVQSSDPVAWSGYTEQLADWPECPMTQAAGLYRPTGGGKLCVLCVSESALAICLQMPAAVVLTPISSLPQTHLYRNMKSRLELASGTLMLFFFFTLCPSQHTTAGRETFVFKESSNNHCAKLNQRHRRQ